MIGKKLEKFNNKGLLILLLGALSCFPANADTIRLVNPTHFEPLKLNSTAQIRTEATRTETVNQDSVPSVVIPNAANDFFAPVLPSPSQYKKGGSENPFDELNTIKSPSEFASHSNDSLPPKEQISEPEDYYASIEENIIPDVDYEGKTISQIKFNGLNLISENVVYAILKTHDGSTFNSSILQKDLQDIYTLGYFTDDMYIEPELNDNGTVTLTFALQENVTVRDVAIAGNSVLSDTELLPFIKQMKGLPQNLNLINEAIEKINQLYESKGYILAKVTDVSDDESGTLTFTISEGIIQKIVLDGNKKTKDYIIWRNIMTGTGRVYNEEFIKKDIAKLYSTQIFDEVDREIQPSPDKEGEYILTLKVKEASSNSVSIGGGIDNALGVFGSLSYRENNFLGRNQKVALTGMVGSGLLMSDASIKNKINYQVELSFFEPHFMSEDNTLASKIFYRDLGSYQIPLAIEKRLGWNARLQHKVFMFDNMTTDLGLGYEYIKLSEGDYNKISSLYRARHIDISRREEQLTGGHFFHIAPGLTYNTLDSEFMPREGVVANVNFDEALGLGNMERTNGRLMGSVTKYIPVKKKSTLLLGAKGGIKVHGEHMPEVMAFRLGGPYTVRGFRMNGVGTGESYLMGSAELQTPLPFMDKVKYDFLKNLRLAFFLDAGRVFEPTISSTLYDRPLSAITVGLGLRVNIPGLGPISVDYGLPITNTGHYSSQHGYFTFGTGGLYDSYNY